MAHFAKIDENYVVVDCIVVSNDVAPDPAPSNSEPLGLAFISSMSENNSRLLGTWVQTSFHGNFRKQYASIGGTYDPVADVFVSPQPYPSWLLDENYDWQPPILKPVGDGSWEWDEHSLSWVEVA